MLQSSVTRLQKIDMMLSLMPLHSKRLHCILDVSQTSLRLLCSFSMVHYFQNFFHILYHRSFCFGNHFPLKWAEENLQIF